MKAVDPVPIDGSPETPGIAQHQIRLAAEYFNLVGAENLVMASECETPVIRLVLGAGSVTRVGVGMV